MACSIKSETKDDIYACANKEWLTRNVMKRFTGAEFNENSTNCTFVILTNAEETHDGIKFNTGLNENIDMSVQIQTNQTQTNQIQTNQIQTNQTQTDQTQTDIYFTDVCDLAYWLTCGQSPLEYVRIVHIPDDAIVCIERNKIRANKVILEERMTLLDTLKDAHDEECEWDTNVCAIAAMNGQLDTLKYIHKTGCRWDEKTCALAAYNGHLEVLKYAHENGCQWDENTCANAAYNGHLEVLKYFFKEEKQGALENGCQWDEITCADAAYNGHLEVLKYAIDNGCPWDSSVCSCAAENGHFHVLEYMRDLGCKCNGEYHC